MNKTEAQNLATKLQSAADINTQYTFEQDGNAYVVIRWYRHDDANGVKWHRGEVIRHYLTGHWPHSPGDTEC